MVGDVTRVCLNMIIKNEAERIVRCLVSVLPHVHSWVIVDTGSTDNTRELVRDVMGARELPGRLLETEFTIFRDTRNVALGLAHQLRDDLAWDYLLLTDADMELVAPDGLGALTEPGYHVLQRAGTTEYWNARLVRWDNTGRYVCPTHEYLSTERPLVSLNGPWFRDHGDGANRPGKVERDIALLRAELDMYPDDARCWFYLGNSYRELRRWTEAIEAYERRVTLGGYAEEIYLSYLYASRCVRVLEREA